MTNLRIFVDNYDEEHIIIDHGNDQFTSMPKAHYEAQQVEHLTEIVADETKAK